MAKVRDLRNYYKSLSKSSNGKSPEKIPTFLTSAFGSVNRAEISSINKEIKAYVQPKPQRNIQQFHVTLRMKSENTLF